MWLRRIAQAGRASGDPITRPRLLVSLLAALRMASFAGLYGGCAWLSTLSVDSPLTAASLVWVPAGVAVAGLIAMGPEVLVGVAIASMVMHHLSGSTPAEWLCETVASVVAPSAAVLLTRWAQMRGSLARFYDVLVLAFIGALGSGLIDGSLTVLGRMLGEGRGVDEVEWLSCVMADALGVLLIAPATLVWGQHMRMGTTSWVEVVEVTVFSIGLALAAVTLWHLPSSSLLSGAQDGLFLLLPVLLWAATRFGQRGVVTALGVSCVWALAVPAHERQLFWAQRLLDADRVVALQIYLGTGVLSVLVFGSIIEERRQAIRLRDDFLIVASHELKTPLTALMLGVENLQRRLQRESDDRSIAHRRKLSACHAQVDRLAGLVDGLLDVSRLSGRRLHLHRQPADLAAIVTPILEEMRPKAQSLHCELTDAIDQGLWGLWDCERIQQMVRALLDNACKYGAGHPVRITLQHRHGNAQLCIEDHGIGIAHADAERIFYRFERAVSAQYYGGMGLGLFVARKIARAHGGSLWMHSTLGEGSRFFVSLPRRQGLLAQIFYADRGHTSVARSQDGFIRD